MKKTIYIIALFGLFWPGFVLADTPSPTTSPTTPVTTPTTTSPATSPSTPSATSPATTSPGASASASQDYWVKIAPPTQVPNSFKNIETAIPKIFDIMILASGLIFLVLFIVGGLTYLASAGNEEATGKAKKWIIDAIIGLVIVLLAWAAGTWVLRVFGIQILK